MTTADEYRGYAKECLQWADGSDSEEERSVLVALAEQWTQAALATDGVLVAVEKPPSPVQKGSDR